jgi:hypothetical protein
VLEVGLLLVVVSLPHLVWATLDTRFPDDHDGYYTAGLAEFISAWREASNPMDRVRLPFQLMEESRHHPKLVASVLLVELGLMGATATTWRLAGLPFLWLLVVGSWLAGRQALGHRGGLMTGFVIASLPISLELTRQWHLQFQAACVGALVLAVAMLARSQPGRIRLWGGLGVLLGIRLYLHPIALPDGLALLGALLMAILPQLRRRRWRPLAGWVVAAATALVVSGPFFGVPGALPWWSFQDYAAGNSALLLPLDRTNWIEMWLPLRHALKQHVMSELAVLVFVPGLLLVPICAVLAPTSRGLLLFLSLLVAVQLPLAYRTVGHGGFVLDWVALLLPLLLLSLISLKWAISAAASRFRIVRAAVGVWSIALMLVCTSLAWVPLIAVGGRPDPVIDQTPYNVPILRRFLISETGGVEWTHHFPSRSAGAVAALPAALSEAGGTGGDAVVAVVALERVAGSCEWRVGETTLLECFTDYLFVLSGFSGLARDEALVADARFLLVRLYVAPTGEAHRRHPSRTDWRALMPKVNQPPECFEEAKDTLESRFPGTLSWFDDPAFALIGGNNVWPTYQPRVLLVDRGTGLVTVPRARKLPR